MRTILAFILTLLTTIALADETREVSSEPAMIAIGSVIAMQLATKIDTCKEDPCNSLIHVAAGTALGTYLKKEHGPWVAFWTILAIGVGKEVLDNNFDAKDALMTGLGGLLSVSYDF